MAKRKLNCLLLIVISLSLVHCSTSRLTKPIPKGKFRAGLDIGGPIVTISDTIFPLPLSSLSLAYGLQEKISISGALHTTALLFGVVQLEIGGVYEVFKPKKFIPGFSVSPYLHLMFDTWETNVKLYPEVDLNFYWDIKNGDIVYIGLTNWIEFATRKAHGQSQDQNLIWSPHVGYTFTPAMWQLSLEMKYLSPGVKNSNLIVNYHGINEYGALGLYLSAARLF